MEIWRFGDLKFSDKLFMDLKIREFKDWEGMGFGVKEIWDS